MEPPKVIVIAGPTASGKSAAAIKLAMMFNGEIVGADSMQVYRYMDIGTAKPSMEDRKLRTHHLMDIVAPDEDYTAGRYQRDASTAIKDISSRGKTSFVVGGTGLYIMALTRGLFEGPGNDHDIRHRLMSEAEEKGRGFLYERLREVDPASAERIHPNNIVRLIRALEVFELTGQPISRFQTAHGFKERVFEVIKLGIAKDREFLYDAIGKRVDDMIEGGFLGETKELLSRGYLSHLKPMQGLGYKEMVAHIEGRLSLDEAVVLIKRNTRRYAKRQLTWFRKDREMLWFRHDDFDGMVRHIEEGLG
ncbi:MAG: tRNA (adenosine(37)-N6)-dimethylallyltransferase MiaA [Deltaproteobacteria bacterium]|nr:tRNA (adenosine(37)-N6)-dimethylallyltransferase MiaA [Deltaproteobacteria bacterium]